MKRAAISEIKSSISRYLAEVRKGEEIVITDRKKPIAKIVPYEGEDTGIPTRVQKLAYAGLAKIGKTSIPDDFWKRRDYRDKDGKAVSFLLEERRAGR